MFSGRVDLSLVYDGCREMDDGVGALVGLSARRSARGGLQSLLLISVLVTEIQQRRVRGAGNVLSAQGLGLAGSL
ncbi:hypothetical protein GOB91_28655 [Sinorhizobium meliloti]|nr:hypothetical protein CDO23_08220 [Sinorhizobium meliloti]MDW9409425.1 hypothetical protein [Sinorhizobium meliloti]MDW9442908.1 hypothetical protein [Sinorhizobium meliloti]MDW9454581.1 hypothetical protein [Sinorhizobium meliloti]MDW9469977.1 hypothetical protein [Sinorhizobium meliloti]